MPYGKIILLDLRDAPSDSEVISGKAVLAVWNKQGLFPYPLIGRLNGFAGFELVDNYGVGGSFASRPKEISFLQKGEPLDINLLEKVKQIDKTSYDYLVDIHPSWEGYAVSTEIARMLEAPEEDIAVIVLRCEPFRQRIMFFPNLWPRKFRYHFDLYKVASLVK